MDSLEQNLERHRASIRGYGVELNEILESIFVLPHERTLIRMAFRSVFLEQTEEVFAAYRHLDRVKDLPIPQGVAGVDRAPTEREYVLGLIPHLIRDERAAYEKVLVLARQVRDKPKEQRGQIQGDMIKDRMVFWGFMGAFLEPVSSSSAPSSTAS